MSFGVLFVEKEEVWLLRDVVWLIVEKEEIRLLRKKR